VGKNISRASTERKPPDSAQQTLDVKWMGYALEFAMEAYSREEVPIGAVLIRDEQIIGQGYNQSIYAGDPTAHAEILAIRSASKKIGNHRLPNTTLYVTVEPCMMCLGTMVHARIKRLVFGSQEPKAGAVKSHSLIESDFLNHQMDWSCGILEQECSRLMQDFFLDRRKL